MMVEIFKTNVRNKTQAKQVLLFLKSGFLDAQMNFDLKDCDKILRVEGIAVSYPQTIVSAVNRLGFTCEILN